MRSRVAQIVLIALGAFEQRIGVQVAAVQERHVARVDTAFHRLEPVVLLRALRHEPLRRRDHGEFPLRQGGLALRRTHKGPQHAAALDQRIGFQLDLFREAALFRLRRNLDALARHVIFPAMIRTAQAAFLIAAEPQRYAAMRAKFVDQAVAPIGVPKCEQSFRQQLYAHRRAFVLRKLFGEQRRDPIATEQLAHRRARASLRQQIVLFFSEHCGLRSNLRRMIFRT